MLYITCLTYFIYWKNNYMANSKNKTTEELLSEIKELKQNLSQANKALKKQLSNSRQPEKKYVQVTDSETQLENITELKVAREALKESEVSLKNKLKAITEPEGDISTLKLSDIIDVEALQSMMDDFYQLTGMLGAVLDVKGNVLVAVGWQDICTKFHRCNPDTLKNCIESDTILTTGVAEGTFKAYRCKNNMWDIVTPIVVGGKHLGNVFMGQYFNENEVPDVELFRKQAQKYGFEEAAYLAALDRVPRFSKETMDAGMRFYSKLAKVVSTLSYSSIQQSRMLAERKLADQALRESEERFELAMAAAKDGLYDWNLVTNEIYYSPGWKSMLGYDDDDELPNDFSVWENLIDPADAVQSWKMQQELISKQRDRFELEFKLKHKDGHWVDILSRAEAFFDENSKAIRIVGTHIDITERKQKEEDLLLSEERFRNAITYAPFPIMIHSEGKILQLSEEWTKQTGYIIDDIPTIKKWTLKAYGTDAVPSNEFIENLYKIDKTQHDGEWDVKIKDGSYRIWDFSTSPIGELPNGKKMVISMASDITHSKQVENKIRTAEENLKNTFNLSPSIICKANINTGYFIEGNNAVTRLLGYSVEEFISKPLVDFIHPDDRQRTIDEIAMQLKGKEVTFFENRYLCKDGSYKWMDWRGNIADKNGIVTAIASDISERKLTEIQLTESEEKYRTMIETSNDLIWMLDHKGNFTFINAHTENATGYLLNDLKGKSFHPLVVEDELPFLNEVVTKTLTGESISYEMSLKTVYGNTLILAVNTAPLSANGEVQAIFSFARDITQQKEAERLLKESEKRFKALHNASFGGIAIHDMGIILDCNQGFSTITGYTIEELIGMDGLLCIAEDSRKVVQQNIVASYEKAYEVVGLRKNGEEFPLRLEAKMIPYEGKDMRVVEFRDITEQKQAEEKIRTAEEQLKNTFDLSPSIIAKVNLNTGYFTEVNQAVTRILGYSVEEIISTSLMDFIHPDDRQKTIDEISEELGGKEVSSFENRFLCKDGSYKWMAWHGSIPDENGIVTAIGSDINEHKLAQLKLNQSTQLLEASQSIAQLGGWELDISTNNLFWTAETYRIYDTSPEEFNPTVDTGVEYFLPESRPIISNALKAAIEDGEGYDLELETLTVKGRRIDIRITCVVTLLEGKPTKLTGIFQDITERKEAEKKIRTAEDNLKNTFDLSPSIIAKANMELGRFIQVNKAVTKILGYTIEEFTSKPYMKFIHPDDWQSTIDIATEQLKGNEVTFFENRYLCKDGAYKWMAWHGTKPDKDGVVTTIGSDISERKIIEQEIDETKQFYEDIIEGVQDGIWVTDKNDVIFYGNTALEKISGVPREEIQGKNILSDFPEETVGKLINYYKHAKKIKKPVWYVIRVKTLALKDTWQNGWLIPQYQDKVFTGIICTIRDVTERKEAEGSVRKLSIAVEQSPSMIVITDTEGKLEYVNPTFTELTGYSSVDAIGQKSNILKSGEQSTAFYKKMWKRVDSGKVWRGQFHNKKKNGELFWEAASISAILNELGEIINYIKIGEDITQQKNTEAELKIALEKALESDRLKSAFLANMSHEIRTPMNGILGFVDLLTEPNLSKSQIEKYSAIINKSGVRLLNTINDIIDISKIEAGEVTISTTETSINTQMEELYSFFLPEANRKGLSLILEPSLSAEQLTVNTDSHKLHGILTNLIKNAIKYTERGHIKFGYSEKEDFIEFYVRDTGIGIPKDRLKAIFNRFEQADIEDSKVFEGSGLGLAISKAYTDMIGGELSVTSVEGKGSAFLLTIPYIKKGKNEIEEATENIDKDTTNTGKLNLLIVEDDVVSSELLRTILKDDFRKIIFAEDGIEAIEICKNNPEIDLVLMDINMPKKNGYDATKEIRKFNKDLLIIAQTAYAMHGDEDEALEAGCNDYISKPISRKLLFEIINKLLN